MVVINIDLIQVVFSFISIILASFIIPYLKLKLNDEQLKKITKWVDIAVRAAEQMPELEDKTGEQKKTFVLNFLNGEGIKLSEEQLDLIIESSVNVLKNSQALLTQK